MILDAKTNENRYRSALHGLWWTDCERGGEGDRVRGNVGVASVVHKKVNAENKENNKENGIDIK